MRIGNYNLIVLALALCAAANPVCADSDQNIEYRIKAAFLYNFADFVDWPKDKLVDGNEPIIIGILGKDPFGDAFDPIKNKQVRDKKVIIRRFQSFDEKKPAEEQIGLIRKCHVLFVCPSEKDKLGKIVHIVEEYGVLTVGDTEGFLEAGGIVNFLIRDNKVCFEINNVAAKQAKLAIRSKLLRLAKRVIEDKESERAKD